MKVITPPSVTICPVMELFVHVLGSMYNNKKLNPQAVTRQKLPKYQAQQKPTYQIDSPKKREKTKCVKKQTV